ncbi:hypothetical protein GCM10010358_80550 [Streptomyces minutiscleroticus]|uniref:Uncharacterized protein n=1 Tax=Streptomyces minutiscleroticus TaxID=68238 RepID=A0A918P3Y6_9ACTN|nr:hypothetical protein [Streptomyces minutiscleroticus]GGY16832.1 hypothetical protein GCM10010358_80550 [Streptomyces minutiscleroticus]
MSDASFDSPQPEPGPLPDESTAQQSNGVDGNWLTRRWRPSTDVPSSPPSTSDSPVSPYPMPPSPSESIQDRPQLRETAGGDTHLHGDVDVVAGVIEELNLQTRTQDLLDGIVIDRKQFLGQPFVRSAHWDSAWNQTVDPISGRLRQPVTIIVAPRSCGSTTFALRLLTEHTVDHASVIKLEADWNTPSTGRLPFEKEHAYQLDLKHPENDQPSADFLDALSQHATRLRGLRSHLVLTVAQTLWKDHRLGDRDGIHVIHLREAPDAERMVTAHLRAHGYDELTTSLLSFPKATAALRGLTAVAAMQAARTAVLAWKEHSRLSQQPAWADGPSEPQMSLEERITAALTDWRDRLDELFGDITSTRNPDNPSLPVEDRCLLIALAVRQSAPMPDVARSAAALLKDIGHAPVLPGATAGSGVIPSVLAGRGLRRRIQDVGARVDMQDTVVFDRPTYGRAVLEYVWDNYDVMREPLLTWLLATAQSADPDDRAMDALAQLTMRHGTMDYLITLGDLARTDHPEVLGTVMESAVRNEHIGRLAWEALYRWAEQDGYAPTVIALCRRILEDSSAASADTRRAMVRLRRVAHKAGDNSVRQRVLDAFEALVQQPTAAQRLVDEVRGWQHGKVSARSGTLAFLALMSAERDGTPWLASAPPPGIDVQRAVHDLLSSPETTAEVISRLTVWIRASATDSDAYTRLRDQLLPALRGHKMFDAGMSLMQELRDISTTEGVSVADDFYDHLVDNRLHNVFPRPGDNT